MTQQLEKKITQSKKLIESLYTGQELCMHSAGKDSVVLYDLVKQVVGDGVKYIHAVTTRDPAGTLAFLRKNYPDVVLDMPPTNFGELMRKKGLPTRFTRFCCDKLKERVGKGCRIFEGMRSDESQKRSKYEVEMCDNRKDFKGTKHLLPIMHWTDEDIWAYIRERGLPYMKYYDEPYCLKRHGCVACPLAYYKQRVREYQLFPKWALADIHNIEIYLNTHPNTKLAQVCDSAEEAFMLWVWYDGYIEKLKEMKSGLFGITHKDVKDFINREIGL